MGVARDERRLLCDLFHEVGPDVPTLCGGWTARDLAAHLVVRERRPDAAGGILIKPLAARLARIQNSVAAKPWPELVDLVRGGPPWWFPTSIGPVDELVNVAEFFVHHEDVRRGTPGWQPRPADPKRDAAVWSAARRTARMMFRNSPVGVVLRRNDGEEIVAKRGPNTAAVVGEPGELLLFSFGRNEVRVEFDGEQASIGVVRGLSRGL
ncbi:uncharacterized protein (TIGR03085 family) [Herbihabitans rhizosphaerae]|uniref:Uncharacterized protein (TIGR03085 family) n=1 Tax=Herbihabitans rhizosphaerae TaxID=1872711 RepID=A0A4Q7KIJ2_9PSEU|nr:TIGR03085 family metal-binding protein [Herbihabitans rhizosphaerae]RZS34748.1 uncharacterized protein (TIGR03085 family) [Herbihabitans rhizosphaerae]